MKFPPQLTSLKVAIDVQHLYRTGRRRNDRGTVYRLAGGLTVTEGHAATRYAAALEAWLTERGARVLANDPVRGIFVGSYLERQRAAVAWGADLYLACHLNSGGGSYARIEFAAGRPGASLAAKIGRAIDARLLEVTSSNVVALREGDSGLVCIREFPGPALLLEPFFGDNPRHQPLLAAPRLAELGQVIAQAIGHWWQFERTP